MRANVLIESRSGNTIFANRGIGSGVIMKIEKGEAIILTNRHVIDGNMDELGAEATLGDLAPTHMTVKLVGQAPMPGHVIWIAPAGIDAALVRVECNSKDAETAPWMEPLPMHIGDAVFAIGNPHNLEWTHTQGTISQFRTLGEKNGRVRVIQTQTAINPGNSGGGLYDQHGKLVGINTWTNDKRFSEGISFAITLESILEHHPPGLSRDGDKPDSP